MLQFDAANPRRITPDQLEALTRSIHEFGFVTPVLARREDGVVIGGHQRIVAARRLGLTEVPTIFLDLPASKAHLLNLALNRVQGEWDTELLARMLIDLEQAPEIDLRISGFADDEITGYLRSLDIRERRERPETFDFAAALEAARAPATTRPGDLIRLGDHLILCGDATNPQDVARLLGSDRAAMAFVDPPFGVGYVGGHGRDRRALANDALPPDQWAAFVAGWSQALMEHVDGAIYVCMSSKEMPTVSLALAAAGGHWSDTVIWCKDRFTLGRADFQRQYEPIWYGWREGAKHRWHGGRAQGDVWTIPRPSVSPLHSTMKPLELVERAIEFSSSPGDILADFFLGSGTSVISCERTGRHCRGIELDPHYCDLIVARWESFSGRRAQYELRADAGGAS